MNKVGIIQPNYLPWRGYFDFVRQVDTFIFYDDAKYTKQDWRNRNRMKLKNGKSIWMTVPVTAKTDTLIMDVKINYATDWANKHLQALEQSYGRTPFWGDYADTLASILTRKYELLCDLDIALTRQICGWLGIRTQLIKASDLACTGTKDDRLLQMLQKIGGTHYLSGPAAKAYIQPGLWAAAGVVLTYMEYPDYPTYQQVSEPFDPAVTVLDLLFMKGPEAPNYIWGHQNGANGVHV